MNCIYSEQCWRYAYSRFYIEKCWQGVPPERMALFMAGYATSDMMPRGGVFAETMPHVSAEAGGIQGLCPCLNCQGLESCGEYRKEEWRRASKEKADIRAKLRFPDREKRVWIPRELRRLVCERARWRCEYCGINVQHRKCVVDHQVPLAQGGTTEESNLVFACVHCNRDKGAEVWQRGCRMSGMAHCQGTE